MCETLLSTISWLHAVPVSASRCQAIPPTLPSVVLIIRVEQAPDPQRARADCAVALAACAGPVPRTCWHRPAGEYSAWFLLRLALIMSAPTTYDPGSITILEVLYGTSPMDR